MKPYLLSDVTYRRLKEHSPVLAILPWGATEAHNYHLPHGTDVIEASAFAERGAELAHQRGARVVVLPAIPFGNDSQQLDQVATISIGTATAAAILRDVVTSLKQQGIRRLVILNAHGGNEFKPLVRDLVREQGVFIAAVSFWQMCPESVRRTFEDPGDHAGDLETSLLLHLRPELVHLAEAGPGKLVPFSVKELHQPGVWTPRPWSRSHPDTGSGDPRGATAEKGRIIFETISKAIGELLVALAEARQEDLP